MLESLEERLTPSGGNPTVTQTAGSYTALTAAVAADTASNTNYVIQITNNFTFNSGGEITISKLGAGSTLSIEGQNGTNYTLTGNGNRLFFIDPGQNVTFADLTPTGGGGINLGGAILNKGGDVTFSKVAVQDNTVSAFGADGGGAFVSGNGKLTIQGGSTLQSNHATGTGNSTTAKGAQIANSGSGGGLYAWTGSTIIIQDSIIRNNTVSGNEAVGGGVCVFANSTLAIQGGSTIQSNRSIGTGSYDAIKGDKFPHFASGGGVYVSGASTVQISDSVVANNVTQGGKGGDGTAVGANGVGGGLAQGGGLYVIHAETVTLTGDTLSGNAAIGGTGGNGGAGGAADTGGSGTAGKAGANQDGSDASGGGLGIGIGGGIVTMANCTVAKNTASTGIPSGVGSGAGVPGSQGGGIDAGDPAGVTDIFENNTITQNTVSGVANLNGEINNGSGLMVNGGNPILFNNLIQGNQSIGSTAPDFAVAFASTTPLSNATHNFIGSMSSKAVNTTTNIVGNSQTQLGSVVGVDSNGKPTGGPIYYPLLSGVVSVGVGTNSVLNTIATIEGTTSANASDEIGNPRSVGGAVDLGAVQSPYSPVLGSNPANQTVAAGTNVSFQATASGNPPPSVQWQVSSDGGSSWTNIGGATSTTLTLSSVQVSQNGYEYRAVFSNSVGAVTTPAALLTVQTNAPPVSTSPHQPTTLKVPPLLALIESLLTKIETINANGSETVADSLFGTTLIVSTYDSTGNFISAAVFGFIHPNWVWYL